MSAKIPQRTIKKLIAAALILGVALLAASYVHIRTHGIHLAPGAFIEKAGDRDDFGSMHLLSYDGFRDGKVFLESWKYKRIPETIIYWTELDGLPDDTRDRIMKGTGRWIVERSNAGNH